VKRATGIRFAPTFNFSRPLHGLMMKFANDPTDQSVGYFQSPVSRAGLANLSIRTPLMVLDLSKLKQAEVTPMTLKAFSFPFFSFVLGLALFAAATPAVRAQDDRAADRAAIRAHIDSIFQAFIRKDIATLRATHAPNWLGYLEGSTTMIKGIEGYMEWNYVDPKSPYGMKSYKFREFDMILCST
jgi:hypothetical protein